MKMYFHLNLEGFSNCFVVVNEIQKTAIIIDPGKITKEIIEQIEGAGCTLSAILITHNHKSHTRGLSTLLKIYKAPIFAADVEMPGNNTTVISGDGNLWLGGMEIHYYSVPGHTSDSLVYKIGNVMFVGDTMEAGRLGITNSSYSRAILVEGIKAKILSQTEDTVLMPGHGPPTTVATEKAYNVELR